MPLSAGAAAPDFTMPDHNGNPVTLDRLLEHGPLVLFFYPKDESPGCTRQACSFRDNYDTLAEKGVTVAGVSRDPAQNHTSFIERHNLAYPLLTDTDGSVHEQYGCSTLFGLLTRRVTFLIDTDRKILLSHEDNLRMGSHVEAVLKAL
ncbi:peroxiredoxin [Balneolales bacterium ANBcel1]|nr:peroxiredoxin [Balneolales bacterium ANBcel1]